MYSQWKKTFLKYKFSSISSTLIIGILLSLLIPIIFAYWYFSIIIQNEMYEKFDGFRENTISILADALSNPLFYYSPNNGGMIIETLKFDPRVTKIYVYDTYNDIEFLEINLEEKKVGKLYTNKKYIYKDKQNIGYITITYNDNVVQTDIQSKHILFFKIFLLVFLAIFIVILPLIYFKILKPLQKLTYQAKCFEKKDFKYSFSWKGRDEINQIGNIFELARINTLEHVNELKEVSEKDKLTQLFNRHKTDKVIENEKLRADRFQHTFGIILVDIDDFKLVNDNFGHQMGDSVLKDIANILKNNCREIDTIGRWGGEEFIIICPESDLTGLRSCANKMVNIISSSTFEIEEMQTASVGATLYKKGESVLETMSRADDALYDAKNTGKNRVVIL